MAISGLFLVNAKGELVIYRLYRFVARRVRAHDIGCVRRYPQARGRDFASARARPTCVTRLSRTAVMTCL